MDRETELLTTLASNVGLLMFVGGLTMLAFPIGENALNELGYFNVAALVIGGIWMIVTGVGVMLKAARIRKIRK
jgi:uncharacterized membrane protein YiaA